MGFRTAVPGVLVATVLSGAAVAQTSGLPERKAGWWEMDVTTSAPTPRPMHQVVHICTDPSVDRAQSPFGVHSGGSCPPVKITRTAEGWDISATCPMGAMTMSTTGTATGDLRSRYHVELESRMSPPPSPQLAHVHLSLDAHWVGPCPAGKKPGDVEMSINGNVAPGPAGGPQH